jgi:hypothetical protein
MPRDVAAAFEIDPAQLLLGEHYLLSRRASIWGRSVSSCLQDVMSAGFSASFIKILRCLFLAIKLPEPSLLSDIRHFNLLLINSLLSHAHKDRRDLFGPFESLQKLYSSLPVPSPASMNHVSNQLPLLSIHALAHAHFLHVDPTQAPAQSRMIPVFLNGTGQKQAQTPPKAPISCSEPRGPTQSVAPNPPTQRAVVTPAPTAGLDEEDQEIPIDEQVALNLSKKN